MPLLSKEIFKAIRRIEIQTNRAVNDLLAGSYHSAFKGRGMEFEDVREYQPGDEVRNIDWNVTARMDFPYVKNYREERELTLTLLVDISASNQYGSGEKTKGELIAELAALIAFSAIKNQDKVGLLLFSDQVEYYLPPKKGMKHVLRLIRELLVFSPQSPQTDIRVALEYVGKVQKQQGICFLISDFLAPPFEKELALFSKKHDLIAIGITDPKEGELPHGGLIQFEDKESGEHFLVDTSDETFRVQYASQAMERQKSLAQAFQKSGADFLPLRSDGDYVQSLQMFFTKRKQRR